MGRKRRLPKGPEAFRQRWQGHLDRSAYASPGVPRPVAKGATAARIDALERKLGLFLPGDFRDSWRAQDGMPWHPWPTFGRILAIDGVDRAWSRYADWQARLGWGLGDGYEPARREGPIKPVHWSLLRIPVAEDGLGNGLMLDLDPAHGGRRGQVIEFHSLFGPTRVLADSWADLVDRLLADSRAGLYPGDASGPWARPVLTPRGRPAAGAAKAGRFIGAIPVEGGPLVLSSDAEVDELEARLGHRTPIGYREYVTRLGDGHLEDLGLIVFDPRSLYEERYGAIGWRGRVAECWFWGDDPDLITEASALRYTCFAHTPDGHELIFGPDDPDRVVFLSIGNEWGAWDAGRGLPAAFGWMASLEGRPLKGSVRAFKPIRRPG